MKSRLSLVFVLAVLACLLAAPVLAGPAPVGVAQTAGPGTGPSAPVVASPINAACYVAAPSQCKLHVDPLTIVVNPTPGTYLRTARLQANGHTIYEYGTDFQNPPPPAGGYYSPSPAAEDFPAVCGVGYQVNLFVQDSASDVFANAGQTRIIACPTSNVTMQFLPGTFGQVGALGLPLAGGVVAFAWVRRSRRRERM